MLNYDDVYSTGFDIDMVRNSTDQHTMEDHAAPVPSQKKALEEEQATTYLSWRNGPTGKIYVALMAFKASNFNRGSAAIFRERASERQSDGRRIEADRALGSFWHGQCVRAEQTSRIHTKVYQPWPQVWA